MTGKSGNLFDKKNYSLILVAVSLIVLGFLLMTGSGSQAGDSFNAGIYDFRRITLAPCVLLAGYGLMTYSIMTVSKNKKSKIENGKTRIG